ncbi:MAG: hypothetical protein U0802_20205 [Candidatus Binatia bacterium]
MLGDPRRAEEVGHRAEGEHQMVVRQAMRMPGLDAVGDGHHPRAQVDVQHLSVEERGAAEQLADRVDDVGEIEVGGRHLVQHRREEEEVVLVDQRDLDGRVAAEEPFELHHRVDPAEPAAEDHDARWAPLAHVALDAGATPRCRRAPSSR